VSPKQKLFFREVIKLLEEKEYEYALEDAITDFVVPNMVLQCTPEIIEKGGVSIPLLLSKPGAGKTAICQQKFNTMDWTMLTIQPALKPIEEYGGIPKFKWIKTKNIDGETDKVLGTIWSKPEILVELDRLSLLYELVVFFWDDIHLCGPEHLALMQECFTERTIRGYKLPSNVAILLAGNPSHKAGFRSLSSAIINRCARLPVYSNYDHWKGNFAIKNNIHSSIVSFLGHAMYSKYFHEDEQIDDPWASPRQWTRLSNFLCSYEDYQEKLMPINQILFYANGHVGKEAASQYMRYYEIFSKFDVKSIFENSKNFKTPDDELDRYIFVFAALNYIVNKYNKKTQDIINLQIVDIVTVLLKSDESLGLLLLKEIMTVDSKSIKTKIKTIDIIDNLEKTNPGLIKKILDDRKATDEE
jgi:hypothetical protein